MFNVVWTGPGFDYLSYFVVSQIVQSEARFRFVVNDCPPDQIALMRRFAADHPDRIVEVLVVSTDEMVPHGEALDSVHAVRDDGEFFSFIDPDIKANGPYLGSFLERLAHGCDAVTSGRGVWTDDDVVPEGHPGVSGEYFFSPGGYVFGSPHFAIYRREQLDATLSRWTVGFASRGPDLSAEATERLSEAGHEYWLYDTGKLVNIFLQEDGYKLCHMEHPRIIHIGGMSHFLSTPRFLREVKPRFEVARYSAEVLRDVIEGRPAPPVPDDVDPSLEERLSLVREELVDLVTTYRPWVAADGG